VLLGKQCTFLSYRSGRQKCTFYLVFLRNRDPQRTIKDRFKDCFWVMKFMNIRPELLMVNYFPSGVSKTPELSHSHTHKLHIHFESCTCAAEPKTDMACRG
jgi:hypothetical protein